LNLESPFAGDPALTPSTELKELVEAIAEVIEQVQRSQRAQAEGPAQVTPADTAA